MVQKQEAAEDALEDRRLGIEIVGSPERLAEIVEELGAEPQQRLRRL
jgi:hypothetical protein